MVQQAKNLNTPSQLPVIAESVTVLGFVLFGLFLRLTQFLSNRSLWLDEAMLSLNIVNRSFPELIKPLDYNQGAPIGFLFVERSVIQLFGNHDYTLRLYPLVAGCASVILLWLLTKRFLPRPANLIAVGLFAVASQLIYYSSEVKQYSSDVTVTLMLWLVALPLLENAPTTKQYWILGVIGALALYFSHPALFVLSGIGFTMILSSVKQANWHNLIKTIITISMWAISFFALYLISLRFIVSNNFLENYWQDNFMPLPPWQNWSWLPNAVYQIFNRPIGLSNLYPLNLLISIIGGISLFRRKWRWGLLLTIPILLTLIASALRLYPFGDRLVLFFVPSVLILIAEGLALIFQIGNRNQLATPVAIALTVLVFSNPINVALENLWQPQLGEHLKPVMAYVKAHSLPDDKIYVYYATFPAYLYYAPQFGFSLQNTITGKIARNTPTSYLTEVDRLRGNPRVWFIFSHVYTGSDGNEEEFIRRYLNSRWKKINKFNAPGASAYLYDLQG